PMSPTGSYRARPWLPTCEGLIKDGARIALYIDESLDHTGPVEVEPPIQSAPKSFSSFRRATRHAEIMGRRIPRVAAISGGELVFIMLLFAFHQTEPAIVKNDNRHGQIQAAREGQFSGGHLKTAVADNANNRPTRINQLRRIGSRHTVAHRRPTVGGEQSL